MFSGNEVVRFESDDPHTDVIERVREALETLGDVEISKKGLINILGMVQIAVVLGSRCVRLRARGGASSVGFRAVARHQFCWKRR